MAGGRKEGEKDGGEERKGKKERKKEGREDRRKDEKKKEKKERQKDARVQALRCAATTPRPKLAVDPPAGPAASPHSATPRVPSLSLPTSSFPRPNPTSKKFHPSSPAPLFLSPTPALRSFAPTLLHHRPGVSCTCLADCGLTSEKKQKKRRDLCEKNTGNPLRVVCVVCVIPDGQAIAKSNQKLPAQFSSLLPEPEGWV
jgi:hypothetical protein